MARRVLRAGGTAVWLAFVLALPVLAHEGEEQARLLVEPAEVTAGETVVLAGVGLEPKSDRRISLGGSNLVVSFDTVTTDAKGMFNMTLAIPDHLPAGTYTVRAIGDETLTVDLAVTAAAAPVAGPTEQPTPAGGAVGPADAMPHDETGETGDSAAEPDAVVRGSTVANEPVVTVQSRSRSEFELGFIALLVLITAAVGGLLVTRAERVGSERSA